ncbi:MAG: LysR family transcriptional regulator [Lachnospiraceae bacterium]|nr:LysR family transcriptional regulator [Lachnospiraceae bacterium]
MDTKTIEYMLCIAKNKNIAAAAEELYLTQSALNQQLLKLEHELGAPLFVRNRNNWELTDVGKIYIDSSREILRIKTDAYSKIQDLAKQWKGTIRIGLTPERGTQMFIALYPAIHKKYPDIVFQPCEASVDAQSKMLNSQQLDFGFQTIFEQKYKHLEYMHICDEPFYLCVPKTHPLAYKDRKKPEEYPEIDLNLFRNDYFTLVRKTSTMRIIIDRLFEHAGFKPRLLFDSVSMRGMQQLAANGLCCSIIPRYYASECDDIAYYTLGEQAHWELTVAYEKNHHINHAMRDFIHMATEYWETHPYINS